MVVGDGDVELSVAGTHPGVGVSLHGTGATGKSFEATTALRSKGFAETYRSAPFIVAFQMGPGIDAP